MGCNRCDRQLSRSEQDLASSGQRVDRGFDEKVIETAVNQPLM
jgi:hypothetical protein